MSGFSLRKSRRGFTLIEIMIVVLIIAVLLAIAIPNFMKARDTSRAKACVANLRQIDTAKMQWAMDNKKVGTDVPVDADFPVTLAGIKNHRLEVMSDAPVGTRFCAPSAEVRP